MSDLRGASLQALDNVIADQPDKVGHDFSEATRRLTAYRDALIRTWRQSQSQADRQALNTVNAVLSVVVGAQFPLGGVPWDELRQARRALDWED